MSSPAARRPEPTPIGPRLDPRIGGEPERRGRLAVVPRVRHVARVPFVSLVTLLLLGGVVGLLLFNTSMQQASFASTALESQADNLAARQQTLQSELDELRSPQAVAERARDLGMVVPSTPAFLDLGTGEVVGGRPAGAVEDQLRLLPNAPAKPAGLRPSGRAVDVPADGSTERPAGGADERPGAGSTQRRDAAGRNGGAAGAPGGTAGQEDRP